METVYTDRYVQIRPNRAFNPGGKGPAGWVFTAHQLSNGKILLGGVINSYNGETVPQGIMCINEDGGINRAFNSRGTGVNGSVSNIRAYEDGRLLVSGWFDMYNGVLTGSSIIRLNQDGTLDRTFNPHGCGANGLIRDMAIMNNGKILICGDFDRFNDFPVPHFLARLNEDGSPDLTFNPGGSGADNWVFSVRIMDCGKIMISGMFTAYNGYKVSAGIMRLFDSGQLDPNFNPDGAGADNLVTSFEIVEGGDILLYGDFLMYNTSLGNPFFLHLTKNGQIRQSFNPFKTDFEDLLHVPAVAGKGKALCGFVTKGKDAGVQLVDEWGRSFASTGPECMPLKGSVSFMRHLRDGSLLLGGRFDIHDGQDIVAINLLSLKLSDGAGE